MSPASAKLRIGDWCVDPTAGQISRGGQAVRLEARTMRLLLDLAEHAGQVASIDDLLDRVWSGVIVTPDSVYQAVATLRRLLGDDPRQPRYIATVPRLGYRLVAAVGPWTEDDAAARSVARPSPRPEQRLGRRALAIAAAGAVALLGGFLMYDQAARARHAALAAAQPIAVGVLPFLDMSATMDQLPLADDVTEGLIDKLSGNPSLRTPGFRASFLLRGKHATPAQAARTLGVSYVVDGSVRKSGVRVRIAARLIRADNGFIIWSQTYDEPLNGIATVQAAIAGGVARALSARKTG